jgi:ATP-dependent protease Clp ATPase subunit
LSLKSTANAADKRTSGTRIISSSLDKALDRKVFGFPEPRDVNAALVVAAVIAVVKDGRIACQLRYVKQWKEN